MEAASESGAEALLVFVTAPSRAVGLRLARELVAARLAACVNIVDGLTSVYRWEGEIQEDAEVLLLAKTVPARLPAFERALAEHHPHDVPECVAVRPAAVEERYLAWLLDATREEPRGRP